MGRLAPGEAVDAGLVQKARLDGLRARADNVGHVRVARHRRQAGAWEHQQHRTVRVRRTGRLAAALLHLQRSVSLR